MKSTKLVQKSKTQPVKSKPVRCPPDKLTDEEAVAITDILWKEIVRCKFYRLIAPPGEPETTIKSYEAHGKWVETVYNKLIQIMNEHLLTPAKWYVEQKKKTNP